MRVDREAGGPYANDALEGGANFCGKKPRRARAESPLENLAATCAS
jgi:hypothetical protein